MRIKKYLAGLLVAILLVTALPSTALAATNFTPQYASGHYPSTNSPSTYYSCYLGGTSQKISADVSYGNSSKTVCVSATAKKLVVGTTTFYYSTDSCTDLGTAGVEISTPGSTVIIVSATAEYKIMGHKVADLAIM